MDERHQTPVLLALPFRGTWRARNSPARRIPSHGTDLLGSTYAIDFVAVRDGRRTAATRDWRTWWATEPPERFFAFGQPILAPAPGRVVAAHDGEPDHPARRSQLTLLHYAATQAGRLRRGIGAVAGNHVILALAEGGPYVALVHLRAGTLRVRPGEPVAAGQRVADCGNSGNSTQPHVHVQVMDSLDLARARGLPMAFRDYRRRPGGRGRAVDVSVGMPDTDDTVEPAPTS